MTQLDNTQCDKHAPTNKRDLICAAAPHATQKNSKQMHEQCMQTLQHIPQALQMQSMQASNPSKKIQTSTNKILESNKACIQVHNAALDTCTHKSCLCASSPCAMRSDYFSTRPQHAIFGIGKTTVHHLAHKPFPHLVSSPRKCPPNH